MKMDKILGALLSSMLLGLLGVFGWGMTNASDNFCKYCGEPMKENALKCGNKNCEKERIKKEKDK